MATIGHRCPVSGRWEVMGAVDLDAFRVGRHGQSFEFRALMGTVSITCKCGYTEDVAFTSRSVLETVSKMQNAVT